MSDSPLLRPTDSHKLFLTEIRLLRRHPLHPRCGSPSALLRPVTRQRAERASTRVPEGFRDVEQAGHSIVRVAEVTEERLVRRGDRDGLDESGVSYVDSGVEGVCDCASEASGFMNRSVTFGLTGIDCVVYICGETSVRSAGDQWMIRLTVHGIDGHASISTDSVERNVGCDSLGPLPPSPRNELTLSQVQEEPKLR